MIFWLICLLIALVVASFLAVPLVRGARGDAAARPDVAIYKAQLAELDRDVARGVLAPDEAERARVEVSRRLLAAARTTDAASTAPAPAGRLTAVVAALVLLAVGGGTYAFIGAPGVADRPLQARLAEAETIRATRPDQTALEAVAPAPPPVDAPDDYLDSVAELRRLVPTRPDDLRGWELLAFHEAQLARYTAAKDAQARVLDLKGAAATVDDRRMMVDLMVSAAGGYVSPEAEELVRDLLRTDENSPAGRYYLGALYDQTGRPDIAFRIWRPVVEAGADDPYTALARAQIADAADAAGVEYTVPEVRGPDAADIAAATDMTVDERTAMIEGMVGQLAARLGSEGGPASDWARLIGAYGVLGRTEDALAIWTEAQDVFGADAGAMEVLRAAAVQAGVAE